MNVRKLLIMVLVAILALAAWPVHAQDDGDAPQMSREEMIEVVISAYNNLQAAEYFGFEADQLETQQLTSGEGVRQVTLSRSSTRAIEGRVHIVPGDAPDEVEVTVQQAERSFVNQQSQNARTFNINMDLLQVGGALYVQVTSLEGTLFEESAATVSQEERVILQREDYFPLPWVDITNNALGINDYLGFLDSPNTNETFFEALNLQALVNSNSVFQLTPEMIINITLDEFNESEDQVFMLQLDPAQVLGVLGLDSLFNADVIEGDANQLLTELFAGMTINQTVTVTTNNEDNPIVGALQTLVVINSTFSPESTNGVGFAVQSEIDTRVTYSGFGRSFTLEVPDTTPRTLEPAAEEGGDAESEGESTESEDSGGGGAGESPDA